MTKLNNHKYLLILNVKRKLTMKEKFKSILLELRTSLLNPNVKKELKNDDENEQHKELLTIVDKYYKNIDLFDKEEEHVQKLLIKNAEELLYNISQTYFSNYITQYTRNALFLLNNYYKSENNLTKENNIDISKIEESIQKIKNTNLDELSRDVEKIKNVDLNVLQQNLNLLKNIDLKKLDEQIVNNRFTFNLDKLKNLDLDKFQKSLDAVKKLDLDKFQKDVKNIQNNINLIDEKEFEKRYMKLVSLLNSEEVESNLILYTKIENKPFKLYKNSNNTIFVKAGLETKNMSLPLYKCILIIYNNEQTPFKSYTDVLFPKILDNSIFDEIKRENFIIGDGSLVGDKILIEEKIKIHKNNTPTFSSDISSNEKNDSLNTESDINAFAKLIAYKELKPPLAIGLFGKWGSGKSTFMNNLEKRIKKLSEEKLTEKIFCEKIVHIEFNAWHYSDSNLWANIMIQIFEKLNAFLIVEMPNKIENLYLELESTQKLLKEKNKEKREIKRKICKNKRELTNKLNKKIEKTFKLGQLKDLTKLVLEDEYINSEINNIKKSIPYLKDKSIEEIYIKLNYDLKKDVGIIKKFFSFLKNDKQFQIYLIIGIFIILSILGILKYLDIFNKWLTSLVIIPFGMYWNRFKEITSKVSKFVNFYETMKEKNTKDEVELILLKEEANLESELIFLEEKISLENKRLEEISFEIEHIKSGKFLADFIKERANSNDYKQHLGLISLIRNDLEKLNEYLKEPVEDAEHKIDRIVLYIDDLDRCSKDKIIDVLEAIHLLLAFDLFVVIVGVDTRWIKNSLESKKNLKKEKTATSTEYLEKIFQIPFHINNMEKNVKKEQLKNLMKNDLIDSNEEINDNIDNDNWKDNSMNNFIFKSKENISFNNKISQENFHRELKIEQFEYDYILKNADLLGDTPRTIKRFVNIYRIIRSHEYILNELLLDFKNEYRFIVMLFCLNNEYKNKNDELTIDNYIKELHKLNFDLNDINDLEKFDKRNELFKFISRFSFRDCK